MESSVETLNVDIWAYKVEAEDNTTSIASSGKLIVTNTISLKTKKAKIANMFNYRQTLLIRSLGGGDCPYQLGVFWGKSKAFLSLWTHAATCS